jgi:Uma2 family endonuclease
VHRLSREEYERMVARGALDGMPVELVDGFLVDVSPQGPQHAAVVRALVRWLGRHLELLSVQMPLATDPASEPEPDLALTEHDDPDRHPTTALLVVEVAVTSQQQDEHKAQLYARAGVPACWLVDVPARTVAEFSRPSPAGYRRRVVLAGHDPLAPPVAAEPMTVGQLFRRARLA